ncbi:TIGR02391 family protein [Nocardia asteroides]|uniref:TIGR02391 family protein n=1 Tax=Nocardia asteroides TaxID=1824 RepID=UPI0037C91B1B
MTQTYSAAYLRALLKDVEDFRAAFETWAEFREVDLDALQEPPSGRFDFSTDAPAPSFDHAKLRRRVAVAAGRAETASEVAGPTGIYGENNMNLIARWQVVEGTTWTTTEVLDYTDTIIGRLQGILQRAELAAPPTLGPPEFHALVWGAAQRLWHIEEYRRAVAAAADAVEIHCRHMIDRFDIEGIDVWQQAFSKNAPAVGSPRLRWPGDPKHKSVISMNEGLAEYSRAVQRTIRNQATHGQGEQDYTAQEALERLAALSLLARWIDRCNLDTAEQVELTSASAAEDPVSGHGGQAATN